MAARQQRIDVVDNTGKRAVVIKVTPRIPTGDLGNPNGFEEGLADYFLQDGTRLNRNESGFETINGSRWFTLV